MLLRAQFVIALDNYGAELESVLVRGRLHIDQQAWTATVIDARLVMGGGLGLLVATAAVITVQLETSFAALLSITDALL